MSNSITLIRTRFTDLDRSSNISYGFRLYDNYDNFYCNIADSEDELPENDLEFLEWCLDQCNESQHQFFESILDSERNLEINGTLYAFSNIRGILEKYV